MAPAQRLGFERARRVRDKASWRDTLLSVLKAWNRHQVWKILTAIVVIWIVSGTALHFAERGTNPAFETLRESLWNVWVTLFSGLDDAPTLVLGGSWFPPCLSSVSPWPVCSRPAWRRS